jgi:hypothetical protein
MASAIDPSQPGDGQPASKTALRQNLSAARDELEHGGFYRARIADPGVDLPPLEGTIERRVQERLSERVSILDFGVRPDTLEDYTKEFETAFAALAERPENPDLDATLHIPPGIYHVAECLWNGKVGISGPAANQAAARILYAGQGGPGSCLFRTEGGERSINRTTIENLVLTGYNPQERKIVEIGVRIQNVVDWHFGLNNVFIWGAGKHGIALYGGIVNVHFNQFRTGNTGGFAIWLEANHWYGHSRPVSVHNWTVHNTFDGNAVVAQEWVDQGYIPENPVSGGGWFGRGLVGFNGPNVHAYVGPGRFEQQERPHPDFGLIYDGNVDDPRHSRGVLMSCGGFFWEGMPGWTVVSEKGRLDLTAVGNIHMSNEHGLMYVKDYRDSGQPRAFFANDQAPLVALSGDSMTEHRGGVVIDGVQVSGRAPDDLLGRQSLVAPNSLFIDRDAEGIAGSPIRRSIRRGTSALRTDMVWAEASAIEGRHIALADWTPRLPLPVSLRIGDQVAVVDGIDLESERYLLDREVGSHGPTTLFYAGLETADIRAAGGTSAERPELGANDVGVTYWDRSLERLIAWDGQRWRTPEGGNA